jgi:1-acyl-sn-glycerol-3-phosphate acyltransferase
MEWSLVWSFVFIDPMIVVSTVFCGSIGIIVSLFEKRGRSQIKLARAWAGSILRFAGVRVTVEGLEKIDPRGSYVFAANHLSYMDTPVVLHNIPMQFRFLAKQGLFQIPFLGTHLTRAGHIAVPRDDPRGAIKSLSRAAETIREHGISVLIFPEGGRSPDGALHPFKEGAAYIAIKAGVPVVPVALIGTREVMAMGSATIHSGREVRLRIGDPIPTANLILRDRHALTDKLHDQILTMAEYTEVSDVWQ